MEPQTPGASLQLVGKKVNLLVSAIDKLRQLGLKEIDTELPELVLVGDQTAGKSSLMGAIAEINLPKDDGMCKY
jgi:GTP1/Obg family GTP-binding protein